MKNYSFLISDKESLSSQVNALPPEAAESTLIQIYSTHPAWEVLGYQEVLNAHFPEAFILGQSTTHIIHLGKIAPSGTLIQITHFEQTGITGVALPLTGDYARDSKSLCQRLGLCDITRAVISVADGIDATNSVLYRHFDSYTRPVAVSGGIAVNNQYGSWVLFQDQVYSRAVVAVALHGEQLYSWQGFFNEWNPIGRKLRITQAQDKRVYTIDDQPAHQVYSRYLGDGNPVPFSELKDFPLIRGSHSRQDMLVPSNLFPDGSIEFNQPVSRNERVRFSYNHPALTIGQVRSEAHKLRQYHPQVIFLYNCTSRFELMEDNEEVVPLQAVAPTSGVYCSGELCRSSSQQSIMHHSMTYLALREGQGSQHHHSELRPHSRNKMSPLFSLVRNAISDVDAMQDNMEQRLIQKTRKLTESYRIDQHTGLPNRVALTERMLSMHLNEHLLTMKLSNFPQLNEKYGYQIGEQLLRDISRYLQRELSTALGNDYQLFCLGIGEWAAMFRSDTNTTILRQRFYDFTDQIEHVNFEPRGIPEKDYLSVAVSIGYVSRRDYPDIPPEKVLFKAIEARRMARKNNRHIYSAKQLEAEERDRQSQLSWLSCVSRAVLNNNVLTFAQPIVRAGSHDPISLECLVRIRENNQIITPGQFLPVIEGTHLYTRLSRHMISNTFALMRDRDCAFSINLSPQDLMSDKTIQLLERNLLTLGDSGRVGLEVLESEQIKDYGRMIEVCDHLRDLGARIIVDDFGSGYSNIDEIIKLEPQIVKIDGSLIKTIDKDPRQRKVAQTMVQLCEVFGAKTVAEFVHNGDVCRIAEDMGIDYLQGYHLGEPYQIT